MNEAKLDVSRHPDEHQLPTLRSLPGTFGAWTRSGDIRPLAAWVLALAFLFTYAALQPGTLSNAQLGIICADTLPLAALALGQGIVILTAGIDLSVGGVLSLSTTISATHFTSDSAMVLWGIVILAFGIAAGAINGLLIGRFGLQPFIVTLQHGRFTTVLPSMSCQSRVARFLSVSQTGSTTRRSASLTRSGRSS